MDLTDVRVRAGDLRDFVAAMLGSVGAASEDARITADVLVASDLRGHESHGVARLEKYYVRPLQSGLIDARAELTVLHEMAATIAFDAGNGLGQPATKRAMDACIAKAKTAGMCMASIRHSNHYGIAAYYAMQALEHDMIGYCCTDAGALGVATGGRTAMLGSNPIAFAAPTRVNRPFVLDMATLVVPVGKVEVRARRGVPLPVNWAVDGEGQPTTDAMAVLDRLGLGRQGGLMPLGGPDAGHKGYGLSVMVDILSGVLAGSSSNLGRGYKQGEPFDVGHTVMAINIAAFSTVEDFKAEMDSYIDVLHGQPPAPGFDRVRVAGEPEYEAMEERLRDGIPMHDEVAHSLSALGAELGVASPF